MRILDARGFVKGNAGGGSMVLGEQEVLELPLSGDRWQREGLWLDGSVFAANNKKLGRLQKDFNAAVEKAQQEGSFDLALVNLRLCEMGRKILHERLAIDFRSEELLCLQHRNWIHRAMAWSLGQPNKERQKVIVMLTPGNKELADIWETAGYRVMGLPLVNNEFSVEAFELLCQAEAGVDVLYLMPRYHLPTMVSLPRKLLAKLLILQQRYPFYIIEDDCMAEYWDAVGDGGSLMGTFPNARLLYLRRLGSELPRSADGYFLASKDREVMARIAAYVGPLYTDGERNTARALLSLLQEGTLPAYNKGLERRMHKTRGWIREVLSEANLFMEPGIRPEVGLGFYLKMVDGHYPAGIKQLLREKYRIAVLGEDDFYGGNPAHWGIRLEAGSLLGLEEKDVKEKVIRTIQAITACINKHTMNEP